MKLDKEKLCQNVWKDSKGNILIFTWEETKETLLLCVDGNECSEGIVEETDCLPETVCEILQWYGYEELEQNFLNWVKHIQS